MAATPQPAYAGAPAAPSPRRRGVGARLAQYTGFTPALLLFGGFFLAPMALIVAYSFWEIVNYNVVHHWTFEQLQLLLQHLDVRHDADGTRSGWRRSRRS